MLLMRSVQTSSSIRSNAGMRIEAEALKKQQAGFDKPLTEEELSAQKEAERKKTLQKMFEEEDRRKEEMLLKEAEEKETAKSLKPETAPVSESEKEDAFDFFIRRRKEMEKEIEEENRRRDYWNRMRGE